TAMMADLTREEHRTKAMAVIGMSIGLSFALSLALGPILNSWISVPGIFWLTAVLALGGIALLHFGVPRVAHSSFHRDTEPVPAYFKAVLRNPDLLRLDLGIFTLHLMLTASFVALPFALRDEAGIAANSHGYVYLPILLLSLVLMVPLVILAEKRRRIKQVFLLAVLLTAVAQLGLMLLHQSLAAVVLFLLVFFMAFNVLEALLPSLIAKFAPADKKGTAMGVYSTSQFLGAFVGGVLGGALYGHYGVAGVFGACALAALLWLLLARSMSAPRYVSSRMIRVGELDPAQAVLLEKRLLAMSGVVEASCAVDEGVVYLKVDSDAVDMAALERGAQDSGADAAVAMVVQGSAAANNGADPQSADVSDGAAGK
ncbi:MAG: MFS transporter, partial [Gammaproteobacteria bacterium]